VILYGEVFKDFSSIISISIFPVPLPFE